MDPLQVLPKDAINYFICRFVEDNEIIVLQQVSKGWNAICNQELIWKHLLTDIGIKQQLTETVMNEVMEQNNNSLKKTYWSIKLYLFNWDISGVPEDLLDHITISNSNRKIVKHKSNSPDRYITIWANRSFKKDTGVHRWKIKVNFDTTQQQNNNDECFSYLKIGVCWDKQLHTTSIGYSHYGAGYAVAYKWKSGNIVYGFRFRNDDIVECILDTDASTLSYIHRGIDLGVAFTELPAEVFPAVSLDFLNDCVELLPMYSVPSQSHSVTKKQPTGKEPEIIVAPNSPDSPNKKDSVQKKKCELM